ncbi:MAG: phosphoribosylglycinamide formyltransferase [Cyanobacteriota bacterium]|nr:phosphoribosylglycinamide formyltransferase [Cyanobacteriota bacterium]
MSAFHDASDSALAVQWPISKATTDQRGSVRPLRLAVLASGNGSNFEAVARACLDRHLSGLVVQLVVNKAGCGAISRAERLGIPWQLLDHRHFDSREALDRALVACFRGLDVDLVVMAGWMRIVTPTLIAAFPERIVNIHPSLLPSFRGLDAVGQALAAGVTLAGCTAHLVSEEVDAGRILVQAAVPVLPEDDHATLSQRIHTQEHRILPLAVHLAASRLAATERSGPPT